MSNPTALSHLAGRVATLESNSGSGSGSGSTSVFTFKGQVAASGDLPLTNNTAGDAYLLTSDDTLSVWTGAAWVSAGTVQGVPGADGADGADGVNGQPGADGKDGADGADGVVDYVVRVVVDSAASAAVNFAYGDYIGVLEAPTENTDITLPEDAGTTERVDGKMLRFFSNAPASNSFYYSVKEDGGSEIFKIKGQEAYTMIWREVSSNWLVVPGIINPKSYVPTPPPEPPAE